jgi:DHA3 family macrolide efflux protein-like MFS transporter
MQAVRLWNRDFTLLWQGQLISSLGKQAFGLTALLWMKDATGSGSLVGLVMTVSLLPAVVLGPLAGVLVDIWDRKRIIAWTDLAGGVFILLAAFLFFSLPGATGLLIAAVFAVSLLTGALDTFSQPSIGASIPDIVPKEKLEAANGLNMGGLQVAMFLSQGSSGFLYRILGAPFLVLVNAVTYLYAGATELLMRIPKVPARPEREGLHPFHRFRLEFGEGFRFLRGHRGLWTLILVYAFLNFFLSPIIVLLPFFVEDYLRLTADWYGFLMAAFGIGGLAGFALAGLVPTRGKSREIAVSGSLVLQSALMLVAIIWRVPGAQILLFALIGALNGVMGVNINTLVQIATPQEFRGRVQSLMTTIIAGVMPLGMALGGLLFDLAGQNVPLIFGVSGGLTLAVSILSLAVRDYREFLSSEGARG